MANAETDAGAVPRGGSAATGADTSVVQDAKREAEHLADKARDAARSYASEKKEATARQLGDVAEALRGTADQLGNREQRWAAELAGRAAQGLHDLAGALHERDLEQLTSEVEEYARRQPAVFIGGCVLAGFLIGRFLRSSADRQDALRGGGAYRAGYGAGSRAYGASHDSGGYRAGGRGSGAYGAYKSGDYYEPDSGKSETIQ